MKTFKLFILTALAVTSAGSATGAEPSGYYDSCKGKSGAALLTALCNKISSHTTVSYNGLWDLYRSSDVDDNGKIWDMYSTKRWNAGEKCGSYSKVGDCYNREHSLPKSWFDDASPMYSEAYHIYPTDGKVNGQRGNYPFGECENGTTLSSSTASRLSDVSESRLSPATAALSSSPTTSIRAISPAVISIWRPATTTESRRGTATPWLATSIRLSRNGQSTCF